MDLPDSEARMEQQEIQDKMVTPVLTGSLAMMDNQANQAEMDLEVRMAIQDNQDSKVPKENKEQLEIQDEMVSQGNLENQAVLVSLEHRD